MSLAGDLRNLERQRQQEAALLRTRISTFADSLEQEGSPAQWVREHPYVATAGAALIGFVAAQIPPISLRKTPLVGSPAPTSAPPQAPPSAPLAPAPSTLHGELLALLINLAEQFLRSDPNSASAADASLTSGDGGAVASSTFPRTFAAIPHGSAKEPRPDDNNE